MTDPKTDICDQTMVGRYLDRDLDIEARARVEAHLARCPQCRHWAETSVSLSRALRRRVMEVSDEVDFTALEKQVLIKVLRSNRSHSALSGFRESLKYIIPAVITAAVLIFYVYFDQTVKLVTPPSAIIHSFSGSMSSVMIFETPETHQTILWYNEDTDMEKEHNAV